MSPHPLASGRSRTLAWLGLGLTGLLIGLGTGWAFQRGGADFDVFHTAWRLVMEGHATEIYRNSPDRFLYAPGFAWILAPLGLLPRGLALGFWCLAKAAALGLVVGAFSRRIWRGKDPVLAAGLSAWGVILIARPILIDFQYGQVNTFIMAAASWALLTHFDSKSSRGQEIASWALLGIAAIAKLFPIPLLLAPWAVTAGVSREKLSRERAASAAGAILLLLLPLVSVHGPEFGGLQLAWRDALLARGLPLESHNQSFIALLSHYFTANPTHVISEGMSWLSLGDNVLSRETFELLSFAWSFGAFGIALGWILCGAKTHSPLQWIAVAIGLLVVPSHLVWKPYFVLGLPAAILAVSAWKTRPSIRPWLLLVFAGDNLTGFDLLGHFWGARFESASGLLLMHLILLGTVLTADSRKADQKPSF